MTDRATEHTDLGAYAAGFLQGEERERFESHLEGCEQCRLELRELRGVVERVSDAAPDFAVPAGLEERVLDHVRGSIGDAGEGQRPSRPPGGGWRRFALALAGAAALGAAVFAGTRIADEDAGPQGVVEVQAALRAPDGGATGRATVRMLGIGRVIDFRSSQLPILPKGEYYELWFVGPGDTPSNPNRISAGTFHPDENGRSIVSFTAAVDPKKYPILSVTAEPGDGNPARTGSEVLRFAP